MKCALLSQVCHTHGKSKRGTFVLCEGPVLSPVRWLQRGRERGAVQMTHFIIDSISFVLGPSNILSDATAGPFGPHSRLEMCHSVTQVACRMTLAWRGTSLCDLVNHSKKKREGLLHGQVLRGSEQVHALVPVVQPTYQRMRSRRPGYSSPNPLTQQFQGRLGHVRFQRRVPLLGRRNGMLHGQVLRRGDQVHPPVSVVTVGRWAVRQFRGEQRREVW